MLNLTVNKGNLTKQDFDLLAHQINKRVEDGEVGAMETYITAKAIETVAKALQKKVRDEAFSEADRYKNGGLFGVTVGTREVRAYQFNHDSNWSQLNRRIEEVEEELNNLKTQRAAYEKRMKNIDKPIADVETGDITQPAILLDIQSQLTISFPKQ